MFIYLFASFSLCVRACVRVFVCTHIVEEQVCSVVILKQLISTNFNIVSVHVLLHTKTFQSVNVYFTVIPETLGTVSNI